MGCNAQHKSLFVTKAVQLHTVISWLAKAPDNSLLSLEKQLVNAGLCGFDSEIDSVFMKLCVYDEKFMGNKTGFYTFLTML